MIFNRMYKRKSDTCDVLELHNVDKGMSCFWGVGYRFKV